jgi:probable rRNA maturation factor
MSGDITVQNDAGYPLDGARLCQAAATALDQQEAPAGASLSIVIVDDDSVQALNRQYRGVDAPTDVLSFPTEMPSLEVDGEAPYLGDLIIAYPYAVAQAEREDQPLMDNLSLLVVHGTLHLLGFDHDTAANRALMWAEQDRALVALNVSLDIVPALENYEQEQSGY